MNNLNKLGHYVFKRLCKDQQQLRTSKPMNSYGLYIQPKDLQRYVYDYLNYGLDYMGQDNQCADDAIHDHQLGLGFAHKDVKSSAQQIHDHQPQPIDYDELKHFADGFHSGDYQIDRYWDEPEGKEI